MFLDSPEVFSKTFLEGAADLTDIESWALTARYAVNQVAGME